MCDISSITPSIETNLEAVSADDVTGLAVPLASTSSAMEITQTTTTGPKEASLECHDVTHAAKPIVTPPEEAESQLDELADSYLDEASADATNPKALAPDDQVDGNKDEA